MKLAHQDDWQEFRIFFKDVPGLKDTRRTSEIFRVICGEKYLLLETKVYGDARNKQGRKHKET